MTNENITPQKAILRGQLVINVPGMIVMFAVAVGLYQLSSHKLINPLVFLPGTFLISPLVAWIYWSFSITHWRIWAFSRVDDPLELKRMAVDGGLIWKDGSFFERTEIRTTKQKALIFELEKRIRAEKAKEFEDDPSVPNLSEFKFSKGVMYVKLAQNALIIVVGAYLAISSQNSYVGLFFVGLGILLSIRPFMKLSNVLPVLVLSNDGITIDERTYKWNYISNESAQMEGIGKSRSAYLTFEIDETSQRIPLDDYEVTLPELRKLLNIYRERNKAVNNR
jgi:hypothetical protein